MYYKHLGLLLCLILFTCKPCTESDDDKKLFDYYIGDSFLMYVGESIILKDARTDSIFELSFVAVDDQRILEEHCYDKWNTYYAYVFMNLVDETKDTLKILFKPESCDIHELKYYSEPVVNFGLLIQIHKFRPLKNMETVPILFNEYNAIVYTRKQELEND